jgi:uncharacterized protein (TIGR00369 family)
MNVNESLPDLSGLEQLRALIASGKRPPIAATLDFNLAEVDAGRAVFVGTPSPRAYNPIGAIHGGYAATLLDSACGCAVHSRLDATQGYTTLELKVAYHRAMTLDTGPVRAEGVVLSIGRRVAFAEAKLVDLKGQLCASATSTLLVFER